VKVAVLPALTQGTGPAAAAAAGAAARQSAGAAMRQQLLESRLYRSKAML
jgi:hypothetical protein